MRLLLLLALAAGASAAVGLATLPLAGTPSRARRLAPFVGPIGGRDGGWSAGELPVSLAALGATAARWAEQVVGAATPVAVRLARVHDPEDASMFRFRQGSLLVLVGVAAATTVLAVAPPPWAGVVLLVVAPALAAAAPELTLARRTRRWSDAVHQELPIVGEQLVALLRAGRSPVVALAQIADDDGTPLRQDIARVVAAVHRGSGLETALSAWSALSDVDGVQRLVSVLSLHHRTPDLADLVRGEVDATRAALHRDLLAQIDRRGQQVWIPVTVAALVPGSIFLLIPFFDALRLFGAAG